MKPATFQEIDGRGTGYIAILGGLGLLVAIGLGAAYYMEHHGHVVTGMNNQIVWGMPHVFAVFLIVAASGALNVASIASVFGKSFYKPLAPLSALLAVALLVGGLSILVLDLGRPDRLLVAMTHYNFKSIFAWNVFLYTGFLVVVAVYLWMMMERRFNRYSRPAGFVAFFWRLALTTGTGSIFGFLVARQAYDEAIMAPMFIVMSFAFGLAVFMLVLMAACYGSGRALGDAVLRRLANLLGVFVGGVLFLVTIYHLTNLYATEHHGVERFILLDDRVYTTLFWLGQVILGSLIPLALFYLPTFAGSRTAIATGATLVVLGGFAHVYVIIIGGQAFPLELFPGYEVSSSFYDGEINRYSPSIPEILLGLGGSGLAGVIIILGMKLLRFVPTSLADAVVDPHQNARNEQVEAAQPAADSI